MQDMAQHRWKKSPQEVWAQLMALWEHYRQHHDPDPAEVVEDIFTDILDRLTGFCQAEVAWTEPVTAPDSGPGPRGGGNG